MITSLPQPIAAYFAAETAGPHPEIDIGALFDEHASVRDEGHEHRGRAAILAWKADVTERYGAIAVPIEHERHGDTHVVVARVRGNFPGSPVVLRFAFELAGAQIVRLEIGP